jgi:HTH-type transcriptional regulator/antitoxin HigA
MVALKYTVIKNKTQYNQYCRVVENLTACASGTKALKDEIDLLTLLIEKWDAAHNTFKDHDPVQLLKALMDDHGLKAKDLSEILKMSKGYVSDILGYKKGFSKEVIRTLADHFRVSQEAFNRPYKFHLSGNEKTRRRKVEA